MKRKFKNILFIIFTLLFTACNYSANKQELSAKKTITIWLIGDSTVADYSKYNNYKTERFPITGWGQVFQPYMSGSKLEELQVFLDADSVIVDNRAVGGRSTRTFFQEGRWREVYESLQSGDFVLMQFGHNDASESKTERYVNIQGYKEFLHLFIAQTKEKNAIPILLTPVARNYPWNEDKLNNVHGDYPKSMKEIAAETNIGLIDLNQLSMDFFTTKGKEYVAANYFMNLPAGKYEAYPDGQKDNTHFQPEGAKQIAKLVFSGIKELANKKVVKE